MAEVQGHGTLFENDVIQTMYGISKKELAKAANLKSNAQSIYQKVNII